MIQLRARGVILVMVGLFGLAPIGFCAESTNAANSTAIDSETLAQWSAPFRNWHYWPTHVIPDSPPLPGATNIMGTDVPTVFQIPGDEKWHMSFVAFDGIGYQSYI